MLRTFWARLSLSIQERADSERAARTLRAITLTLAGAALLAVVFEAALLHRPALRVALWATLAGFGAVLWLTARGLLSAARFVLMLALLGVLSFVLYTGYSGIHGVTTMLLPLVIVVGSLVLDRRGFVLITILTALSAAGLVVADIAHAIHTPYHDIARYEDVIAPTLYLLITAIMVRFLAADLTRSLDRARRNERELEAANSRLVQQAAALEQSEARWRAYIEQANDFVFMLDARGRFSSVNRATCEAFGYRPDEVLGRSAIDFVAPEDRQAVGDVLGRVLSGRPVEQLEARAVARDGRVLLLEMRGRMILEHGHVVGTIHIARDITARRQAEEERRALEGRLQHSQKLESLGVLAGGVAHDFNNLLMAILGNLDLALDTLPSGTPAADSLKSAERASRRAAELTRQMLAYAGRGKFSVEPTDISRLVEDMAEMLRASVGRRAGLRFDLPAGLPLIHADASQVRQVVVNLVINAAEAVGDGGGTVTVSTGAIHCTREDLAESWLCDDLPAGPYATLEVTDTGCGMDAATLPKIFDPFFTTKFTGRGLGLASVLGIVRGHGAGIRIRTAPGEGASFRVLFPVGAAGAGPGAGRPGDGPGAPAH